MTATWRLLETTTGSPAWNMAVDEALSLAGERPTLRRYQWSPAGLSLGTLQRAGEIPDELALEAGRHGAVLVRRVSGGGAILHARDELTWSVTTALPSPTIPGDVRASYALLNEVTRRALQACGLTVDPAPPTTPYSRDAPFDCFARATCLDVTSDGRKLAGSAQRRPHGRFLEHVSIPAAPAGLAEALAGAFTEVTGARLEPGELTDAERALAEQLEREKHSSREWVHRR